jgi:26S proteasome regulatory subunit N9
LKLAHIAVAVAKEFKDADEAVGFLNGVVSRLVEAKQPKSEQPILFLKMNVAQYQLQSGNVHEAKALVEEGKETLDALHDVRDPAAAP